jgi:hemin uptake protein HemP
MCRKAYSTEKWAFLDIYQTESTRLCRKIGAGRTVDNTNENTYRFCVNPLRPPLPAEELPRPDRVVVPRRVTSGQLLGPKGELVIEHQGREYRLRLTQNGKLILTA